MKFRSIKDIENFIPKKGSFKHYLRKIEEEGRIVKGVNTTVDVGVNQVPIEAKKLGNTVDKDGRPPTLSTKVKGKSTNVLFNLGLAESKIDNINESVLYLLHNLKENMGEISKTTKINPSFKICRAYENDGKCLKCRACWKKENKIIAYMGHGASMRKEQLKIS